MTLACSELETNAILITTYRVFTLGREKRKNFISFYYFLDLESAFHYLLQ